MSEKAAGRGPYRLRPDSKGRITLGRLADGVSSYRAKKQADGKIILEPFVEIPADERWLWENKEALESVKKGIEDAKVGRLVSRGSFKKYLK
jgi:hypothetical protein